MQITTESVKRLREITGAGVMDCKRALQESSGDEDAAIQVLRGWGLAAAEKKMARVAAQGIIESYIHAGGRIGVLVELNCETDFVARNPEFKQLAHDIAMQVAFSNPSRVSDEPAGEPRRDGPLSSVSSPDHDIPLLQQPFIRDADVTVGDLLKEAIAKFKENIVVRRFSRFEMGS